MPAPQSSSQRYGFSYDLETLPHALERSDVTALLLGILCSPGTSQVAEPALAAFYSALMPVAAQAEAPWALLNALLPAASAPHLRVLQAAASRLAPSAMTPPCKAAHDAFVARLEAQIASS